MTDSIFDSLTAGVAPGGNDTPTAQPDMLSYANQQLSGGMSPDDAIAATYTKYPTQSGVRFGLSDDQKSFKDLAAPIGTSGIFGSYDDKGNLQGPQHLTKEQIIAQHPSAANVPAETPLQNFLTSGLVGLQEGVLNPVERVQGQIGNFLKAASSGQLDTQEGGKITPEQKEAAKLIGADVTNDWGPILKMTPQQLAKYRQDADAMAGLDPKEQAKRDEDIAAGKTYSGPIEGLLQHSAAKDLISSIYNPNESNTILYHKVNEVVHLLDVEKNPQNYSDTQVKSAKEVLDQYREDAKKSTWQKTKESLGEIQKHPLALVNSTIADPELFLAPELKLGSELYGAKATAAAKAADQAARYQKIAESISMAGKNIPDIEEAANAAATHHGQQAEKLLKEAQALRTKGFLGDVTSAAGGGAAINAAITAEQQTAQQGYVKKGSIAPAAIVGSGLGGGLAALGGAGALRSSHADMASRVDEATTRESGPDGEGAPTRDPNAGRNPGQPLSPETPINKESHVPYYGGVDKDGHIIHLDKDTPEFKKLPTLDGNSKQVPVLKTVAYHEQVEYPLMHMEGPASPEVLADLQKRMSAEDWNKIPKDVIQKLKDGKSLTYPEAHTYFATAAENHLVRTLYNVDPNVYQKSLKPHIKDIAEANKTAKPSDIPSNLDSKPYDDMGGTESLKGEGDRPAVDQVEPGAAKHSDNRANGQQSEIDAYHGSNADIEKFHEGEGIGPHFGTPEQAAHFANRPGGVVYPVKLKFKNTLALPDGAWENPPSLLVKLEKEGIISEKEMDVLPWEKIASREPTKAEMREYLNKVKELIKSKGYDSIAYHNRSEGPGISYIPLDPKSQVTFRTTGRSAGKIDPRLLATGAAATAGSIFGAYEADQDHKVEGTIAGGLAGLALGHVMGRGDIPASGLGKGEAGMFGGAKMEGYSPVEERLATRMEEMGKTPEQIHLATGMSREAGGTWVKEIPDHNMSLVPKDHPNWERAAKEAIPASTLVNHPDLDAAYPGLMDKLRIKVDPNLGSAGSYSPKENILRLGNLDTLENMSQKRPSMDPKSVIAHELQHAIQKHEGMPGGTSIAGELAKLGEAKEYLENFQESQYERWMDAMHRGDDVAAEKYDKSLQNITKQIDDIPNKSKAAYAMEAGEVQARNVQQRLKMTPEERAAKSPRQTEDVPLANQRVNKQSGQVDPELLKKLGKTALLGTVGATLGASFLDPQHKIKGAWAGAALALVGGEIKWNKLYPAFKDIQAKDPRFNVNDVLDNWDHARASSQRTTYQVQRKVKDLAPDKSSQIRITHWLDGDKTIPLTNKEYAAAKVAREFYNSVGQAAMDTGVLKDFLTDYVNHEWGDSAKAKQLQDQIEATITTNMSPKDRHALARRYMTIAQGKEAGLTPRTENVLELMGIYNDSMSRAMANKTLLDSLKAKTLDPKGEVKAVMPAGKSPYNYTAINHPQLGGVRVHPSIAPSLDFLFHTYKKNAAINALESANTAVKRMQVSFSMFHVKSLIDAYLGANTLAGTFRNLYDISTSLAGKSAAHRAYVSGSVGDAIDAGLRGGLKLDMGSVSSEDVNANALYGALDHASNFLDSIVPGAGKLPAAVKAINKASDKFIWENAHSGFKGMTFMNVYERLQRSWAKERLNNPNAKVPSNAELAKHAASFTNDIFGGLNWRRLADDATTKYGRATALAMASPAGRRLGQVTLFAPDWTYSTIRSFVKAFGEGSGVKGLLAPKTLADLHRQYIVRSSFIYLTLYNAVNMAMSGHPIWDNKDPLMVDLGNGEKMQANKHFLEVPHLVTDPAKFLLGKLGTIPSEALDQLLHKDYVTPQGGPPMQGGRIEHAASRALPFSLENNNQGASERAMSMLGFPIYGQTKEQKSAQAREKARQLREKYRRDR